MKMKCVSCNFEAPKAKFRYLYNARIDASGSYRQCPKCMNWLFVDELKGEAVQIVKPGDALWGKSAGIEGLADDVIAARG
ncbi:MAG: hypothetical protein ACOY40_08950 [Bacillota bacterium]|jgi:hypothetical protein